MNEKNPNGANQAKFQVGRGEVKSDPISPAIHSIKPINFQTIGMELVTNNHEVVQPPEVEKFTKWLILVRKSIQITKPMTPVLSISHIVRERMRFAWPSPSGESSISPRKNTIWTKRTNDARMYLSAIEAVAGPPLHIGVSDSVISGKSFRIESSSISDLKLSIYCDI